MINKYEVHCGGRIESQLDHDYDLFETDNLALYRSYSPNWEEKSRGELILTVTEFKDGISIKFNHTKKLLNLDASQEEQLLIALLHRNDCKIQIKESKIIKEI
jgi:hypothetical protein